MGDRAGSSPVARTNKKHPIRGAFYWLEIQDENPSKCGADEHRRRGLDRAAPLFSFPSGKENANRVLSSALYRVFITDLTVVDTRFSFQLVLPAETEFVYTNSLLGTVSDIIDLVR